LNKINNKMLLSNIKNDDLRSLIGTFLMIFIIFFTFFICYKIAICREENEKKNQIIIVKPQCPHCHTPFKKFEALV
jgi:hypothetical protein